MGAHRNFCRKGQGTDDKASAGARAYNGGLGRSPPAGSRGRAPGQWSGVRGEAPLKLNTLKHLHTLRSPVKATASQFSSLSRASAPLQGGKCPPCPCLWAPMLSIITLSVSVTQIVISLVNNRPSANNFSYSATLQNWTRATNVRLRLLRTKTLLGHLMAVARQDPTVTRRASHHHCSVLVMFTMQFTTSSDHFYFSCFFLFNFLILITFSCRHCAVLFSLRSLFVYKPKLTVVR